METQIDFNPNDYSHVPLYNIQAVASATGVPAITLRSWERRYGIPDPKRDTKGYRLYSQRDVAVARWLSERVQQGIGISRAVNMLRLLDTEAAEAGHAPTFDFDQLRAQLIAAVVALDEASVNRAVARALMVAPVEDVALDLIQPVLCEIGERWKAGSLSVTCEHVASHLLRSHLTQLIRLSPAPIRDSSILVGCAPGELHDIGALMLTLFLRRRGHHVIYAGASVEDESFIADVLRMRPNGVCLSASLASSAESLAGVFSRLQDSEPPLLGFGGHAYREYPAFIEQTPGIYLGEDARIATHRIEDAFHGVAA